VVLGIVFFIHTLHDRTNKPASNAGSIKRIDSLKKVGSGQKVRDTDIPIPQNPPALPVKKKSGK
jgi:hypothetical protein